MGLSADGARVAELGPGVVFGAAAFLRCSGAEVTLIDRWLTPWKPGYHDIVYAAIISRIEAEYPESDCTPLRNLIADGAYRPSTLNALQAPLENLQSVPDGAFDVVISNAVLEHIAEPGPAFSELYRITRRGGVGIHQVDYRDHRNFDTPLEHLLLSTKEFENMNRKVHMEFGSQRRHSTYASLLQQVGFSIEAYHQNATASDDYLDEFLMRAKQVRAPVLSAISRSELANLGGLFLVRRS
jgi:SAM-dependent methyltransferase